jgi:hypothetical protein
MGLELINHCVSPFKTILCLQRIVGSTETNGLAVYVYRLPTAFNATNTSCQMPICFNLLSFLSHLHQSVMNLKDPDLDGVLTRPQQHCDFRYKHVYACPLARPGLGPKKPVIVRTVIQLTSHRFELVTHILPARSEQTIKWLQRAPMMYTQMVSLAGKLLKVPSAAGACPEVLVSTTPTM